MRHTMTNTRGKSKVVVPASKKRKTHGPTSFSSAGPPPLSLIFCGPQENSF
ncbi:hypothetical protein ES319_A12G122200v1 [Gossypium barbadense]|uniref:Uncharacterized protein n=2 Tax=Gossypium TaxID=3633 RepID=A0A5J5TEX8_GOSBA|nr:hypothetical protein ES319_A12G122200v1 [Gossypium barbadense]TYG89832.1 hypothetical protein ES288_A12G132500v1 [Gossypium darwinii]